MDHFSRKHVTGIYAIVNNATKMAYIGHSRRIVQRWQSHRMSLIGGYHHNVALQSAWACDGEAAFGLLILERTIEDYQQGGSRYNRYRTQRIFLERHWLRRARSAGIVLYNDQVGRARSEAA